MPDGGREADALPETGGVYALLLRVEEGVSVRVGALGRLRFEAGWYCYVGSARAGLRARLRRHLRAEGKRLHWHVDYLRRYARPVGALIVTRADAQECSLSDAVARAADRSVPGFGAGDCRCRSHLHYFRSDPTGRFAELVSRRDAALTGRRSVPAAQDPAGRRTYPFCGGRLEGAQWVNLA
ncbi:MAG: GIY-YIG nuclease family protein, partial [Candidatus Brocadiia bacterium]